MLFEIFDAKAAAFAMERGHKLVNTRMDETGRVLFQFDAEGITETLRAFANYDTTVGLRTYNAHYGYLMNIVQQYKRELRERAS